LGLRIVCPEENDMKSRHYMRIAGLGVAVAYFTCIAMAAMG
jgi:hypothetical protein